MQMLPIELCQGHFGHFFSENKCGLLLRCLIESLGDVTKADIACNLEWPLKFISGTANGFVVCITKQEVKVIWQKAPHGGPIPRLGVTPGGRKLYH